MPNRIKDESTDKMWNMVKLISINNYEWINKFDSVTCFLTKLFMWIYSLLKNKIDKLASKFSPNPTQLWISKNKINKIAHPTIACTFDIQFIGLGCKSQVDVHCCTSNEISFLCCIKHGNVFTWKKIQTRLLPIVRYWILYPFGNTFTNILIKNFTE